MKKIFFAAIAVLTLSLVSCQKEENNVVNNSGNNEVTNPTTIKSTSDLHGTNWNYTTTYSELIANLIGADMSCVENFVDDTLVFGLNFDGTYAHFSIPSNVEAYGGDENGLEQISGVSYEYSYDGTTHTGYLNGVAEDADSNTVPAQLVFTYNDSTDVITFNLPLVIAEDSTSITFTMNFTRNN